MGPSSGCITRWGSFLKQFEKQLSWRAGLLSMLVHSHILLFIIQEDTQAKKYIHSTIKPIILNQHFWIGLQTLVDLITPLQKGIDQTQKNQSISAVWKVWIDVSTVSFLLMLQLENKFDYRKLESQFSSEHRKFITGKLLERWRLFSTRIHIASFLVDPRFRDIPSSTNPKLLETQFKEAESFLIEFVENQQVKVLKKSWIAFRGNKGAFKEVEVTLFNLSTQ